MNSKIVTVKDPKELVGLYAKYGENYYRIEDAKLHYDNIVISMSLHSMIVLKGQELKLYELEKHESYDTEKICVGKTIESVTHYGDFSHGSVQQSSDTITTRFTDGSEWDIRSRLLTEIMRHSQAQRLKKHFSQREIKMRFDYESYGLDEQQSLLGISLDYQRDYLNETICKNEAFQFLLSRIAIKTQPETRQARLRFIRECNEEFEAHLG